MTSFIHTNFCTNDPGVDRMEPAYDAAGQLRRGYDSARSLAAVLLAATVAAMLVVADQVVGTWADGDLLAAWIAMWLVGFAALALFAGTTRKVAIRAIAVVDGWSRKVAQKRADERLWAIAQKDPRVMADFQTAMSRSSEEAPVSSPVAAMTAVASEMPFAAPRQRSSYGFY